jgi:tRNA A-37 threonylcarbamoyl transferase component Bud32/dipeptidyl aminopeptidase/acylaminoacyl peptidase
MIGAVPTEDELPEAIAHFRVTAKLGQGGMGVVYRARDRKLGRVVALKVLPPQRHGDARRVKRLLREARAAAGIRHPGVATVYEVGEDGDVVYIAMELVEGRTLRQRIDEDGPMSLDEALGVLVLVAEALEAAHGGGIVHRDLKDDNVMLTPDGGVKLLDFGIAKDVGADAESLGEADTEEPLSTRRGPLGTPGYMSPEQVRGGAVDARSDLFAFGVLAVRIVTGAMPFRAKTRIELLTAPLHADADVSGVPPALASIASRCLEREPSARYAGAGQLLDELRRARLRGAPTERPVASIRGPGRRRDWLLAGAPLVAAGVAAVAVVYWHEDEIVVAPTVSSAEPRLAALHTQSAALRQKQATMEPASEGVIVGAISPDGGRIAFGHVGGVFVRELASGDKRRLGDNPSGDLKPVDWMGDEGPLVVTSGGEKPAVWKLALSGEKQPLYAPAFMAAVAPDGARLAIAAADGVRVVAADGSEDRLVLALPRNEAQEVGLRWNRAGDRILVLRPVDDGRTVRVETISPAGGAPVLALEDAAISGQTAYRAALWLPDGRMVVSITEPPPNNLASNFWETTIDPATGACSGPLERVTSWPSTGLWYASMSRDGARVALSLLKGTGNIMTAELTDERVLAAPPVPLGSDTSMHYPSAWLDADTVIYSSDRNGQLDVFSQKLPDGPPRALLAAPEHDSYGLPTADGKALLHWRIAWDPTASGVVSRLFLSPLDGTAGRELLTAPLETARFTFGSAPPIRAGVRCSGPAATCVVGEKRGGSFVIHELDLASGRGAQLAQTDDGGGLVSWDVSPDGKSVVFLEARLDHATSVMHVFNRGSGQENIELDRSCSPTGIDWARDDELFLSCYDETRHVILRVGRDGKTALLYRTDGPGEIWQPLASPDGRRLMYRRDETDMSMWVIEGW